MKDNKFKFTNDRLRKLTHDGSNKRLLFWDTDTKGLAICLTKAGTKSFQFQMWSRTYKKSLVQTLGTYPAPLSLNEAREQAASKRVQVNTGEDIVSTAQNIKNEDTFAVMFEKWLEQFAKPHKKSWDEDERRYNLYMKKPFGKKKVSWFTTSHIRKWHGDITHTKKQDRYDIEKRQLWEKRIKEWQNGGLSQSEYCRQNKLSINSFRYWNKALCSKKPKKTTESISPATANRALALVSTIFNQMRPDHPNPCKGIKKFKEQSRDRFLQANELKRFFTALYHQDTSVMFRDYALLSIFIGGRRGNILSMRWNEISFDRQVWTVPGDESKNTDPMDIPLVAEAIAILEQRKRSSSSVFVFPGTGKTGHYVEPRKAWESLLKRAGLAHVRIHDLRRTLGSYQTITGASLPIVGKTLGHKSHAATTVYARLNLDPVRASMEIAVKAMLATLDLPDKVVSIVGGNK